MISLEELSRFIRLYMSCYRIEHEVSLAAVNSMWSCQLRVEPPLLSQTALLRKVFKWAEVVADQDTGALTVKLPAQNCEAFLDLMRVFCGFNDYLSGLVGSRFRLQLVLAPLDRYYQDSLSRDKKWEWLLSSPSLTELYAVGTITEAGPEFEKLFHSCHQSFLNTDISELCFGALRQWEKCYQDVCGVAGVVLDSKMMAKVVDPESNKPRSASYRFPCEDPMEASRLYNLCVANDIAEKYSVKAVNSVLVSNLSCITLADLVFSLRFATVYNLFGADPED